MHRHGKLEFREHRHICTKDLLNIFVLLPALNPYVRAAKPGVECVCVCVCRTSRL